MTLNIPIFKQPRQECGTTCLQMVLSYWGKHPPIEELKKECSIGSPKWRDWEYRLGLAALKRAFKPTVITMQTFTFDPTWFNLSKTDLIKKLKLELEISKKMTRETNTENRYFFWHDPKLEIPEIESAIRYLEAGGEILFKPLSKDLIKNFLSKGAPIIAPHNPSIIHKIPRQDQTGSDWKSDDIGGSHWGHIVVVAGYDSDRFFISDPSDWFVKSQKYWVEQDLFIEAVSQNDHQLLIIDKA